MLALKGVNLTKHNIHLLKNIDINIAAGEVTILIGPNGAGKSTLLNVCSGDLAPSQGQVTLNQKSMEEYRADELAITRAVMTQSYEMGFAFTVEEIVAMGCFVHEQVLSRQQRQAIVQAVMQFMGIEPLAERNFMTLSGGEQQRTQLARVLAQLWHPYKQDKPRYLFLDEPTSSLDIYHQYHVLALAKQLAERNMGILAVVHDLALAASFADTLVMLAEGRIVASGSPESVLEADKLASVYNIQAQYFRQSTVVQPTVLLKTAQF